MEIKKRGGDGTDGAIKEAVLKYLLRFGKENKYRLARVFKVGTEEVIAALQDLKNERKIEMEGSKARPITKAREKELERGVEKVEEVEASEEADKTAEESEKGIGQ